MASFTAFLGASPFFSLAAFCGMMIKSSALNETPFLFPFTWLYLFSSISLPKRNRKRQIAPGERIDLPSSFFANGLDFPPPFFCNEDPPFSLFRGRSGSSLLIVNMETPPLSPHCCRIGHFSSPHPFPEAQPFLPCGGASGLFSAPMGSPPPLSAIFSSALTSKSGVVGPQEYRIGVKSRTPLSLLSLLFFSPRLLRVSSNFRFSLLRRSLSPP